MRFTTVKSLLIAGCLGLSSLSSAQTIDVLTTEAALAHAGADYSNAPAGWRVNYYDLDEAKRLQEGLSGAMPRLASNPTAATTTAQTWLQSDSGRAYIDKLNYAFEGYSKVINYGVDRLPAIVINGEYVFYGVQDLKEAIDALPQ